METELIEIEYGYRPYGFDGIDAIVLHPIHGKIFICDGYGGDDLHGYSVQWRYGVAIKLLPEDTFETLRENDDGVDYLELAMNGYDPMRPGIDISPAQLKNIAKSAQLDSIQL